MKRLLALFVSALFALSALAQQAPFTPVATTSIAVTASAQTHTLPNVAGATRQMVFTNVGTQTVFFLCDGTLQTAPTTVTSSNGMPIGAGVAFIVTLPYQITRCSVIAGSTGSTLYTTSGFGQ